MSDYQMEEQEKKNIELDDKYQWEAEQNVKTSKAEKALIGYFKENIFEGEDKDFDESFVKWFDSQSQMDLDIIEREMYEVDFSGAGDNSDGR